MKKIKILATGGTIAGKADNAVQMTGYKSGALSIEQMLAAVPDLSEEALLESEQISNIGSENMTEDILLKLSKRCNELLLKDDIAGIVITHGTDTLEETAYFLHLTVHSKKPVVVVGAMRPATALSADGPLNLLNAVKIAAWDASEGQGVLVVMNDEIYSARDVSKTNTANVATFKAPSAGPIGYIVGGNPYLYYTSLRKHTFNSEFYIESLQELPRVDIIYAHVHEDAVILQACINAGAKGIVYAGSGMGSLHNHVLPDLQFACNKNISIVRSSRTGSGIVAPSSKLWTDVGFIDADSLNPQKARILLQLALTKTNNPLEIQKIFSQY